MTTAEYITAAGLPSMKWVHEETGISRQTLDNWFKHRPEIFRLIIVGLRAEQKGVKAADIPLPGRGTLVKGFK